MKKPKRKQANLEFAKTLLANADKIDQIMDEERNKRIKALEKRLLKACPNLESFFGSKCHLPDMFQKPLDSRWMRTDETSVVGMELTDAKL